MKSKSIKEPAKNPRGRPPILGATMRRVYIFLGADHIERAVKLGAGNLSAGIRKALENHR